MSTTILTPESLAELIRLKRRVPSYQAAIDADILESLLNEREAKERQYGYLLAQRDDWERKAISNFEECSEMASRIEELESQRKLAFTACNRWRDKFAEADKRIAELEESHRQVIEARDFYKRLHTEGLRALSATQNDEIDARCHLAELQSRAESAEQRVAELESKLANPVLLPKTNGYWTEQEKAFEEGITLAKHQIRLAGFRCEGDE